VRRDRHARLAALACGVVLALVAANAPAGADEDVGFHVRHAIGGVHRFDGLVSAAVTIENRSPDDLTVHLESETDAGLSMRSIDLPGGARKALTFYLGPVGFEQTHTVSLRSSDGDLLRQADLTSIPVPRDETVVGIVGDHPMGWGRVEEHPRLRVRKVHLSARELPSRVEGLRALDGLVWHAPRPSTLRPEQVEAVAQWTESGGRLVLILNDVWLESSAGSLDPWTRIRATRMRTAVDFPSLARMVGLEEVRWSSPVSAVELEPDPAEAWHREPWGCWAAIERRGRGSVALLGVDPSVPPLGDWDRLGELWIEMLQRTRGLRKGRDAYGVDILDLRVRALDVLTTESEIEFPSPGLLLLAFAGFLLVTGPAEYFILKKARRLSWTWVTFPVVVALFSIGTYSIALSGRSGEGVARHILLRDLLERSDSFAEELYVSLFVPNQGPYRLEATRPEAIPQPMLSRDASNAAGLHFFSDDRVAAGTTYRQDVAAVESRVPKWSFLTATFTDRSPAHGSNASFDLALDGTYIAEGTVRPRLGTDLEDAWILLVAEGIPLSFPLGALGDDTVHRLVDESGDPITNAYAESVEDEEGHVFNFVSMLLLETVRRAYLDSLDDTEDNLPYAAALAADFRPHLDWSPLLDAGGGVLVGLARDTERRFDVRGRRAHGEGYVLYRVPIAPEEIHR
jgi:hypothetical protein